MPLRFHCECGQKLKCPEEKLGKRARCPKCGASLRVPQSDTYDTLAEKVAPKHKERGESSDEKAMRVVVADSVAEDREHLSTMLRQHGYKVSEAADGPQAVELIREKKPDAAILDIKLDILSGFQVVDTIRNPGNPKNEAVWKTPIIMSTAKLRGRDKQYAMSLGAKGFFLKPILPAQICPRLEKAISRPAGL